MRYTTDQQLPKRQGEGRTEQVDQIRPVRRDRIHQPPLLHNIPDLRLLCQPSVGAAGDRFVEHDHTGREGCE